MLKKTKIVATIGPASESPEMLERMAKAGMNVGRVNFSHGTHESALTQIRNLRAAAKELGMPIAVLQDLSGPKIRIGDFYQDRIILKKGSVFTLTTKACVGDEARVFINYKALPKEVKKGDTILLDDGKKKLEVISTSSDEIKCRVIVGGETKGRRGVNLPGVSLKMSCLTPKDRADLTLGIKENVDFVALSFVRSASDIRELRRILVKARSVAQIIAKVETQEAVARIDEIVAASDGIMVARGDLAVEVPAEQVPILQKMIIEKCNVAGKPVIVATQMLESMIKSSVPTRAEVSDVANSILDGADAVMLSEESALGSYPVEAVAMMTRVALMAEKHYPHNETIAEHILGDECDEFGNSAHKEIVDAVTFSAVSTASAIGASAIVALTKTGLTARMISRFRPEQLVIVVSPTPYVIEQTALSFGCYPVLTEELVSIKDIMEKVRAVILAHKIAKKGDKVVIAAGLPFGHKSGTNTMLVEIV